MATVGWLIKGKYTDESIITAPDAPANVGASVERLHLALNKFTRPEPAWYRAIDKTGYWWYLICMAIGAVAMLAVPNTPIEYRIGAGLGLGLLLAPISGWLLGSAARAADKRKSNTTPEKVERKLQGVARRITTEAQGTVDLVLDRAPDREAQLHDLLWRSAAGSDSAVAGIDTLIAEVAPDVAADRKAEADSLLKQLEADKKDGKF